jgi:hypothetical protein
MSPPIEWRRKSQRERRGGSGDGHGKEKGRGAKAHGESFQQRVTGVRSSANVTDSLPREAVFTRIAYVSVSAGQDTNTTFHETTRQAFVTPSHRSIYLVQFET